MKIILPNGMVVEIAAAYTVVRTDSGLDLKNISGHWLATVPHGSALIDLEAKPKIGNPK